MVILWVGNHQCIPALRRSAPTIKLAFPPLIEVQVGSMKNEPMVRADIIGGCAAWALDE